MSQETKKHGLRIDKWLWFARFFKTRALAHKNVVNGHIRINGYHIQDPAKLLKVGDILTIVLSHDIKVICVEQLGSRRGPAVEAVTLYRILHPEE